MPTIPQVPGTAWRVPARYDVRAVIGRGSYATVREAVDIQRDEIVAIKQVRRLFDHLVDSKRILREVAILAALKHECVVLLHDVFVPPGTARDFTELYIVMEICDSDMKQLIYTDVTLTMAHIVLLEYNLLRGLKYLHSAGIYHRDLKPANCLVNQDCSVKIADFNLARPVAQLAPRAPSEQQPREGLAPLAEASSLESSEVAPDTTRAWRQLTQYVATRWYRDPQVILLQAEYTESIDTWAAACIFAELLQMLPGGPDVDDRGPLFPGGSCFPLSPGDGRRHTGPDQLGVIFDLLGTPSEAEVSRLEREDARRYVRLLPRRTGTGVQRRFNYVAAEAVDLLQKMLKFEPQERICVDEALEHVAFSECRNLATETLAPKRVTLDFEGEASLDEPRLRHHFNEVLRTYSGANGIVGGA